MAVELKGPERGLPLSNQVAAGLVADLVLALESLAAAVRASAPEYAPKGLVQGSGGISDEAPAERAPERESGGRAPSGTAAAVARATGAAAARKAEATRKGRSGR
jgi:hypothetical protein